MPTGLLARLRASQQNAACTITRPDSDNVAWNGTKYVPDTLSVYTGQCLLQPAETQVRIVQAGDRAQSLRTYKLTIPASASVLIDDDVTVDTSPDSEADGMMLRVIDVPKDDLTTVRTLMCEERT